LEAILGGADIIDVKNPKEGPLGASFPWIIRRIKELAPEGIEVSCTLGDVSNLPGTISLAALGAASIGVDYIKASLHGLQTKNEAIFMMQNVVRSVHDYNPSIKVAAAGFADAQRVNSLDPLLVPEIASESKCDIAMVDTAIKDEKNLLDFLNPCKLKEFVGKTHEYGLKAALAGSLRKQDLGEISALDADIIGLRGAACTLGDRVHGQITREKVRELAEIIKKAKKQTEPFIY
jgi:(5-formylfuran-3-yl)methyl phosphate synthase